MRKTQTAIIWFLIAGVLFLILVFLGGFSTSQSIILAFILSGLLLWIDQGNASPTWKFTPYYVSVAPKWYDLLTDFNLIRTPEQWRSIQESFENQLPAKHNMLRDGIHITFLHEAKDFNGQLIYVFHGRNFVGSVDFEEELESVAITREHIFPDLRTYNVRFFMKAGSDGHDLGIVLPDWWWMQIKEECPKPLYEDNDHPTGQVRLTLATIPYREFDLYWWAGGRHDFFEKAAKEMMNRRDEQRNRLGWTVVEHPDLPELAINWAESIEHKYFQVKHREI